MSVPFAARLQEIRARMRAAEKRAGRVPDAVGLLPVSKGQELQNIDLALDAGFPRKLGENYLEELETKVGGLRNHGVEWHYQGRLQSRKIKRVVELASVVQTIARPKELEIFADACRETSRAVDFYVQVNISSEDQKNGLDPRELPAILELTAKLGLEARFLGLMALPSDLQAADESKLRGEFSRLRELRDLHCPRGKLNMGMSNDFEIAIEEGSDLVRVGTALFGSR